MWASGGKQKPKWTQRERAARPRREPSVTAPPPTTPLAETLRRPGTVLLDGVRADADTGRAGTWLFSDPHEILRADRLGDVERLLESLDRSLARGQYVAGWLAYEAAYAFDPDRFAGAQVRAPLAWFGIYDAPRALSSSDLDAALCARGRIADLRAGIDEATYIEQIGRVRRHIREGDVYQINLTWPLAFESAGDALGLYGALRAAQPTAYGAFIRSGDVDVLSLSPELFFRVEASGDGRTITARPMKGTAPRGATPEADDALAHGLAGDEKNRAENLMIVDLLRNDIGRVATPGSVRVPELFGVERYPTVTQMTSTVQADLAPEAGLGDVVRALFPCGSVTGAPKLRAMEIIRDLERSPRGVYCGAIGYAAPAASGGLGSAAFNVPIRTATLRGTEGEYRVGSGVVWDSDADAEWAECWLKARPLTDRASGEATT